MSAYFDPNADDVRVFQRERFEAWARVKGHPHFDARMDTFSPDSWATWLELNNDRQADMATVVQQQQELQSALAVMRSTEGWLRGEVTQDGRLERFDRSYRRSLKSVADDLTAVISRAGTVLRGKPPVVMVSFDGDGKVEVESEMPVEVMLVDSPYTDGGVVCDYNEDLVTVSTHLSSEPSRLVLEVIKGLHAAAHIQEAEQDDEVNAAHQSNRASHLADFGEHARDRGRHSA